MTWKELFISLGLKPKEAAKVNGADRELDENDVLLIRTICEAVLLGQSVERRRWEAEERWKERKREEGAAQDVQAAAQSAPAGGTAHKGEGRL